MKRRILPMALLLLALLASAAVTRPGSARADLNDPAERLARFKQAQHEMLMREPFAARREAAERYREAKKAWKKANRHGGAGERLRRAPDAPATGEPRSAQMARIAQASTPASAQALSTNTRVNNPATDSFTDTAQSEVSIAQDGNNIVVGWNDGEGLNNFPYTNAQGYGYSTDGGLTWTDGGAPPSPGAGLIWYSDPVLTVNNKTHEFFFSALFVDPNNFSSGNNGVGVVKGTFSGGAITWGTPVQAIAGSASSNVYDKEWIAADSTTGNLYVAYVNFFAGGDQVDFRVSTDGGATFGTIRTLSATRDKGYVQAPRIVCGPTGLAHFVWYAIGNSSLSAWGRDYFRARTFNPSSSSLGSEVTVDSMFVDFGNGGPGFNRGNAFAFPGAAIDNTTGPNRGRMYVTWNESVDFYNSSDYIGYRLPAVGESVDYGNASGSARSITIGDVARGTITSSDQDWFKFTGAKDSTVIVFVDSVKSSLQPILELYGSDGVQQLAMVSGGQNQSILIVFSLPQSGTYYLRMRGVTGTAGGYAMFTGYHRPMGAPQNDRARDHRDIYLKYTDTPSGAWGATTVRVNSNPADFDDWLPEVAVGGNGKPYVAWYDFHDHGPGNFPGSGSTTYLSRSDDGGVTWAAGSPVSDVTTYWWSVASNIAPNQGDYIALHGTSTGLLIGWADGRDGDPNVYASRVDLAYTAITVSLASATATPGDVALVWQVADSKGFQATLERRSASGDWSPLTTLIADGTGRIAYDDTQVTAGRWGYRLRWSDPTGTQYSSEAWVDVPGAAFALRLASPNPSTGTVKVEFSLPDATPATLEMLDVTGREIARLDAGSFGAGTHVADLAQGRRLPAGVYLVRLTQGRNSTVMRATVIR